MLLLLLLHVHIPSRRWQCLLIRLRCCLRCTGFRRRRASEACVQFAREMCACRAWGREDGRLTTATVFERSRGIDGSGLQRCDGRAFPIECVCPSPSVHRSVDSTVQPSFNLMEVSIPTCQCCLITHPGALFFLFLVAGGEILRVVNRRPTRTELCSENIGKHRSLFAEVVRWSDMDLAFLSLSFAGGQKSSERPDIYLPVLIPRPSFPRYLVPVIDADQPSFVVVKLVCHTHPR